MLNVQKATENVDARTCALRDKDSSARAFFQARNEPTTIFSVSGGSRMVCSLVPSPPLPQTKWPRRKNGLVSLGRILVLAIPNNSGQSHRCMVTCLQKSRAKLVGDESQLHSVQCFCRPATRRRYSCLYIRGETIFVFLPTGAGKSLCSTVLP